MPEPRSVLGLLGWSSAGGKLELVGLLSVRFFPSPEAPVSSVMLSLAFKQNASTPGVELQGGGGGKPWLLWVCWKRAWPWPCLGLWDEGSPPALLILGH